MIKMIILFLITSSAYLNSQDNDYHHHAGLFTGASSFFNNGEVAFSLGLDYSYVITSTSPNIAFGILIENTFHHGNHVLAALTFSVFPIDHVRFYLSPGINFIDSEHSEEGSFTKYKPDKIQNQDELVENSDMYFNFGLGADYSFHTGRFAISPGLRLNLTQGNGILTYGVTFSYLF